jgi:hypothetical protein
MAPQTNYLNHPSKNCKLKLTESYFYCPFFGGKWEGKKDRIDLANNKEHKMFG